MAAELIKNYFEFLTFLKVPLGKKWFPTKAIALSPIFQDQILKQTVGNSLSGDEVCFDAWRQGSWDPFAKTIFEPARYKVYEHSQWQFSWQSTPSMTCSFYLAYYPVHMTFTYGLDTRRLCENKHSISKRWIILVQRFSVRKYQKRKLDILIFISNLKYLWIEICLY